MTETAATRKDIDEVIGILHTFIQQVDDRFSRVERDIADLKTSHNRLINTIDGFVARIDRYETELAARDSQLERLLAWARKVSEKTGIPLEV
ncbi:MAG TPA: hypothetical protein VFT53_00100 [Candidatus Saccharimonadales bacterium]|nr:hypothetical protein [Candidatus Saccharimonadales bacterium]